MSAARRALKGIGPTIAIALTDALGVHGIAELAHPKLIHAAITITHASGG